MKATKRQTFTVINIFQGCSVQQITIVGHCCVVYLKVAKKVDCKSSHHKRKNLIFFLFSVSI